MAERAFQAGGYDFAYYVAWLVGGIAVGYGAGVVLDLNPVGTAVAGVGALLVGNGLTLVPSWYRARNVERSSIVSLDEDSGAAEIVGNAREDRETLTAPFPARSSPSPA